MRYVKFLLMVVLMFGIALSSTDVMAQNPRQTKKRMKKMKKLQKKRGEPHEYNYHSADSDGDGVPDGRDKCLHTPEGQEVTPFGCPDSDKDGQADKDDKCPNDWGTPENYYCPDTDGDGILDFEDHCPTVVGPKIYHGCPDTDGDGLIDVDDKCPNEPGPKHNNGCPVPKVDTDGDGLTDDVDNCPKTPGPKSNKGCPEIKEEEKKAIQEAFENLLFETGKDIIKTSSYTSLNKLAGVMLNNSDMKLHLAGHTDNVGDDDANMDLSRRRSEAVKQYLVNKGVSGSRITTEWFGETRPVASNDTPEGRKKNRRVEMELKYD